MSSSSTPATEFGVVDGDPQSDAADVAGDIDVSPATTNVNGLGAMRTNPIVSFHTAASMGRRKFTPPTSRMTSPGRISPSRTGAAGCDDDIDDSTDDAIDDWWHGEEDGDEDEDDNTDSTLTYPSV
jgi:hypothetical protein